MTDSPPVAGLAPIRLGLDDQVTYNNEIMIRSIEEWRKIRALVEKGLSLNQAAKQFGLSFSHLQRRAAVEGWKLTYTHGRGRPRTMDYPDGRRRAEMAREQAERDAQQAELLVEARVAVFDTTKAELVTQKILAQHSIRMKVALSELVVQTTEDLRSAEVRPKDRALAMVALKTVSDRLYGWDREPDIAKMQQAISPLGPAINLALINTTPEQLRALGDPNRDSREGVSVKGERNGLSMGPSVEEPEQATAFPPVSQPKQEASSSPVEEPAPSSRTLTQERVAPPIAPRQPVQGSPPCSPAAQEREAFERARDEHRKDLRERQKYR